MLRPNPNFTLNLAITIITLLDSIGPKHFNTKTLQVSLLVFNFARYRTNNTTQKYFNFVVES